MERKLIESVEALEGEMVRSLCDMIAIPAISPESGGDGEYERARFLESLLSELGMGQAEHCDAPDRKAKGGRRPNLILRTVKNPALWIVSHMDTVPPGDRSLWKTDPFKGVVKNGRIYGRGSEDNGQSLIASIYAVKAALDAGLSPEVNLAFVSDEELGSEKGIGYLARKGMFHKGHEFLVPDAGNSEGSMIEVAEKSSLWMRIYTRGKQTHASTPSGGINAAVAASRFLVFIRDYLYSRYVQKDELFDPVPFSTFEPTKRLGNVENVNTIPGTDEFYIDCRILPAYRLSTILNDVKEMAAVFSRYTGARIEVSVFRKSQAAPPTSPDAPISQKLFSAVKELRGKEPKFVGIGGGTCANIVRALGLPAVVWSTECGMAHEPNEFALVKNLVEDAKVMAQVVTQKRASLPSS